MNILLWVLQVALAWLSIAGGAFQIFKINDLQKTVAAMRELPQGLWAVFGTLGCLAGVCLIVPGVIKVLPVLTPVAAAVIAVQSVVITALYLHYGDRAPVPFSVTMAILATVIAIGRFALKPL
jgi:uncharacterized membrane protein YphA (DoxX/SURF4 family)